MGALPSYSTRRFLALLSISIVAGTAIAYLAPPGLNYLFPATLAYFQVSTNNFDGKLDGKLSPSGSHWAKVNHTLVVTRDRVESFIELTAFSEPYPSPTNVTIQTLFKSPYTVMTPVVTGGNVMWFGELHEGQSVAIHASLSLPSDGRYFIAGQALSTYNDGSTGDATVFYLEVEWGQVIKVSSRIDFSGQVELRCLSNC